MSDQCPHGHPLSRREFLASNAFGIGSFALASLLNEAGLLAAPPTKPIDHQAADLRPRAPHMAPQATAMISLFMHGGPAHMDLLDPKPELTKHHGQEYSGEVVYSFVNRANKKLLGSPYKFEKRGECGTEISELLPNIAGIADDICVMRSMHTGITGTKCRSAIFMAASPQ